MRYVDRLIADGSGLPVRVAGRAVLQVRLEPAQAHDAGGQTSARRRAFALPNVMTVVRAGDFEGVTTYGIGLARRTAYDVSVLRNPSRVVVDVRAAFPTEQRRVWFLDSDRFVDNVEPYFVPRSRPVPASAPATGLMDRIFAGVLPRERAQGLRLLRSGATGWDDLRGRGRDRPGAADRRLLQRRLDDQHRRRDHPHPATAAHGGLGEGLRPGRAHRLAERPERLHPGLPQPLRRPTCTTPHERARRSHGSPPPTP